MGEPTLYIVCEKCNRVLDPDEPDSVHAVKRKDMTSVGAQSTENGLHLWFHEGCYPGEPHYRRFDS